MKYIECPNTYTGKDFSLFLAGGITSCPPWQTKAIELLKETDLVLFNPKRKDFSLDDINIEEEQIHWEYTHLQKADIISFWFPKETLCPITLYELGKQSMCNKPIFIGVDPEYKRKKDIEIQTKLIRPEIKVVYSLEDLTNQIKSFVVGRIK
jgi:hypothetical protein